MRPVAALIAVFLFFFASIVWRFYGEKSEQVAFKHTPPYQHPSLGDPDPDFKIHNPPPQAPQSQTSEQDHLAVSTWNPQDTHHELFSVSTKDKKYFRIDFGDRKAINPNIIPHPHWNDSYIIVAQHHKYLERAVPNSTWFAELSCNAVFQDDILRCTVSPAILPIPASQGDKCTDSLSYFGLSIGPHDARVFWGPHAPYTLYGSVSQYTCFGQYLMDFRMLVDWGFSMASKPVLFRDATEVQRPEPWAAVEKNWFLFWDRSGERYVHFDIEGKRTFAALSADGSVGEDLALEAPASDGVCMERYMPQTSPDLPESIHQATNSLAVTMCERADPACVADDGNTFVFSIFHHKTFFNWHGVYEPYVFVFQQTAPFAVHGISRKPLWFHGRGGPGRGKMPEMLPVEMEAGWNQTEMLFTTSLSWKTHGQKYHGYLDDVVFIGFGIEDSDTGGLDVLAGDLLQNLGLCSTP